VSEAFELGDQPPGVGIVVAAFVPIRAEVAVGPVALQHPVGRNQDRMRDRDLSPSHPAPPGQASLIALVNEQEEGMYEFGEDGELVWREAPEEANAHIEVAVADASDGRFLPGLAVTVTVLDEDAELFTAEAPFLWHSFLFHYGINAKVGGKGPYTVKVHIDPPTWMRHDPVNGRRYAEPVDVVFVEVGFDPGRKTSPNASPMGGPTGYAGG
jgi:hypothetical protein